jgi:hypothetical protein
MQKMLPKIDAHMRRQGVLVDMYLLPWSMTLFSKYFPLEITVRTWDR